MLANYYSTEVLTNARQQHICSIKGLAYFD